MRVVVTGLKDLGKALGALEQETPNPMRKVMKDIAEDVAKDVRVKVPQRSGKAARSYRARGGVKGASIAFGGSSAPYAPWLDFGGTVGIRKTVKRRRIRGGRYLYPTIADRMDDVQAEVVAAVNTLTTRYGIKAD